MIGYDSDRINTISSCVWYTHDKKDDNNILSYLVFGEHDKIIHDSDRINPNPN